MDTAPGTRGIVIGDRYRVAGALRRTGLVDAVDLEADRADAACRVVGVPGDAERVDAWEDAWRAAQDGARLPRLREIVADEDGAHWAVLAPSRSAGLPLPGDAHMQARAIGEALAAAGLDASDVTCAMLVTAEDGRLCLDGAVWLGGGAAPHAAGRALAGLLPRAPEGEIDEPAAGAWSPPRRTVRRPSRRRRAAVPAAILATMAAAATVLFVPSRSGGTAVVAPGAPGRSSDALLASATYPVAEQASAAAEPQLQDGASGTSPEPELPDVGAGAPAPPVTVTVVVPVAAPPESASPPASAAPALPVDGSRRVPDLPAPAAAPALPAAAGD